MNTGAYRKCQCNSIHWCCRSGVLVGSVEWKGWCLVRHDCIIVTDSSPTPQHEGKADCSFENFGARLRGLQGKSNENGRISPGKSELAVQNQTYCLPRGRKEINPDFRRHFRWVNLVLQQWSEPPVWSDPTFRALIPCSLKFGICFLGLSME